MSERTARDELLDALMAERYNGGGWATPPRAWNAEASTACPMDDDEQTGSAA